MAQQKAARDRGRQSSLDAKRFCTDGGVTTAPPEATPDVDLSDVPLDEMALEGFPDPEKVRTLVDEDEAVDGSPGASFNEEDIDPEANVMLVMNGREVAEYLCSQQKKTDHWLKNELSTLLKRTFSNGRGMARRKSLSDYDKEWLVRREIKRRQDADEWDPVPDSKGWQSLPNADN